MTGPFGSKLRITVDNYLIHTRLNEAKGYFKHRALLFLFLYFVVLKFDPWPLKLPLLSKNKGPKSGLRTEMIDPIGLKLLIPLGNCPMNTIPSEAKGSTST